MQYEFQLNTKLEVMKNEVNSMADSMKEDRKDARVDRQAGHQKEMITQRSEGDSLKKFESSGNDIVTGDAGLDL